MKSQVLSIDGAKLREIELPKLFSEEIREDIVKKVFETEKTLQPYGLFFKAGRQHSASGIVVHRRHKWKSAYGRGISRIPRKVHWRRGSQFYWVGAEVSGTRGGRKAHGPKPNPIKIKKINKKEYLLALRSALASSINKEKIKERYARLSNFKINNFPSLPIIIESKILELKSKDFNNSMEKILGDLGHILKRNKKIRAGKGKLRNRRYKKSAGVLLILGKNENIKIKSVDSKKVNELLVKDLYPLGRVVIFTENAIKELKERLK
ncbi:MAG: 50S ribosomal protein L4 [Candidatus Pacearchaeota archaeon]